MIRLKYTGKYNSDHCVHWTHQDNADNKTLPKSYFITMRQLTTTLHHWLSLMGKSRCDWTHLAYDGYITVSLVGRMAMGSARSVCPERVTHAT